MNEAIDLLMRALERDPDSFREHSKRNVMALCCCSSVVVSFDYGAAPSDLPTACPSCGVALYGKTLRMYHSYDMKKEVELAIMDAGLPCAASPDETRH